MEAQKPQGAPAARNGQYALDNVRETQGFGARLQNQDLEASAQLPGWSGLNSPQFCNSDKGSARKIAQFCNSEKARNRIAAQFCNSDKGHPRKRALFCNSEKEENQIALQFCISDKGHPRKRAMFGNSVKQEIADEQIS